MRRSSFQIRVCAAILVTIAAAVHPAPAAAQRTVAADAFVDSAGVNVHLHYNNTIYWDQFPLVKNRLLELGVRHVRDGLIDTTWQPYYARHNELGAAGIKGTFIIGVNDPVELLAQYPARMSQSFEAFEAPNEYDWSNDPNWVQVLRNTVARLGSVRNDPRAAGFAVLGPALGTPSSYAQLGDLSAYFDAGNLHNYFGGRHPGTPGWGTGGYGSIAWNLQQVGPYSGGKRIVTTETGYQDDPSAPDAIPPDVSGRYMPRILLEQFRAGILRTYIYELADFSRSGGYGLLHSDGSPKPAFTAVKGLLNLLADPGPAFAVQSLGYAVTGATADVEHLAFQKRDGRYYLALWLSKPMYDVTARQYMPVAPQRVTVTLPTPMRHLATHRWQGDGSVVASAGLGTGTALPVDVSDALTILELGPPGTAAGVPDSPVALQATAAYTTVSLAWQAPAQGASPTGYLLEAAARRDFAGALSLPFGLATGWQVGGVAPGLYFVRVRASNAYGVSAPSNVVEVVVGAPQTPQLATVQAAANPITLAWSAAVGADHYLLSAGLSPGASDLAVVDMGRATSLVAPIPPGVRIYARIAAINAHGSARSNEVSFAVGTLAPPGKPLFTNTIVNGANVVLAWSAGPGGRPESYVLQVGTAPGTANLGTFALGALTTIAAQSPIGGRLYVRLLAQNAAGAALSDEISFVVGGGAALERPEMQTPVVSGSTVQLAWTASSGAASYTLVARTVGGIVLATLPVAGTSVTVPGVPAGTYQVSVIARNGTATSPESIQMTVQVR